VRPSGDTPADPSPAALAARRFALLRLGSAALPIGGYSYSQGLEAAIERGWVRGEDDMRSWLEDLLEAGVGRFDAPLVHALARAVERDQLAEAERLHALFLASRESAELRAETLQMGRSLLVMVAGLDGLAAHSREAARARLAGDCACALPLAWAWAARGLGIGPDEALAAWLWAWLENQVAAAMKAIPLGQQAGQRLVSALAPRLAKAAARSATLPEDDWSGFAPGFAMGSSWHETQYSRLFRS
jgi:urease accessory protein